MTDGSKKPHPKGRRRKFVSLLLSAAMMTGCTGREKTLTYFGKSDLKYYEDTATKIQYADVDQPTPDVIAFSRKPRLLGDRNHDEIWDMTLTEAIHLALANNKIIRTRNDFLNAGEGLYTNPDGVMSVYDPAIQESGVLFGGRGVESALSAFDTQWSTSMLWGTSSAIQNNTLLSGGITAGSTLNQDSGQFSSGLTKNFAYGAQASVTQNWNYSSTNQTFLLFHSAYQGNLQFNYTQPLWAGAGAEFTRIAGPLNTSISGLSGVNQGVVIARIGMDMSIVNFEIQVRNMLNDVEGLYWDLYLAYRTYDSQIVARNSALRTWREVKAKADIGARGGGAADEAQARENYFNTRSLAEDALQALYSTEIQLRRICGLASNDGRIIRPADEPVTAEFIPDWHICLAEALTRREELRRQKWNVKSYELQLVAAKSLANPQLNFVSSYQLNGFGHDLFDQNGTPPGGGANLQSAYSTMFAANQTGWTLGFQFNLPLGLRNALAQVRNYELRVAKAREVLAQQEVEINHELANSFQTLEWRHMTAQTNFNRRRAAEVEVQAFEAEYRAGTATLDLLLQAQARLSAAEIAYYTSVIGYNKAITDIHYRKGTLLENNNVHLEEGMWSPEAYKEALRRAWARSYAFEASPLDPVHHEPEAFANDENTGTAEFAGEQAQKALMGPADQGMPGENGVTVPKLPPAYDEPPAKNESGTEGQPLEGSSQP